MRLKEGDEVGYKEILGRAPFTHIGKVYELAPEGIASCPKPMLKIEGKAGFVLESHCILFPKQPTTDEINGCPESVKAYIHDLIAVEPSGAVQDLAMSRDNSAGLLAIVDELKKGNQELAKERDKAANQGEKYRQETHQWREAYKKLDTKYKAAEAIKR